MQTIKLPYTTSVENREEIWKMQADQSRLIGKAYQFLKSGADQKEMTAFLNLQETELDSWMKQSALYDARGMLKADEERGKYRLFGGKKNLKAYQNGEISQEQFRKRRVMPLYIIGEATQHGNRKFEIDMERNLIIFKPQSGVKIELNLPNVRKNYQKLLENLQVLAELKQIPFTVRLDQEYIYITFEPPQAVQTQGKNVLGIDLNPNWIGISIQTPSKTVLFSRAYDISCLTNSDKQTYELAHIAKEIQVLALHYNVGVCGLEDLSIQSKEHNKGKKFNQLVNNKWNRNDFVNYVTKRLRALNILVKLIRPEYSSFVGNLLNQKYYDPVASSIEIGRRAIPNEKFYPPVVDYNTLGIQLADRVPLSLSWKQFFGWCKQRNPKMRYRNSLPEGKSFQAFMCSKSLVLTCDGLV